MNLSEQDEIKLFKDQDFNQLKFEFDESNLFEDSLFPADENSLNFSQNPPKNFPKNVEWLRPHQIIENPEFVTGDFSRLDIDQGSLGDCWFISGCIGIMQNKELFQRVVPENQSFSQNYAGIFHFRFWQYGEWIDVVIDDRLPVKSENKNLIFTSNKKQKNEFWPALLEKAYAKLYGSYERLISGKAIDALIDMSGGIQETFQLKNIKISNKTENFWRIMDKAFINGSIMSCCIPSSPSIRENTLPNGLVIGHAFTITKILSLNENKLIRIRNPWGTKTEWTGDWSDNSDAWKTLNEDELEQAEHSKSPDGEFWMSFSDFISNWEYLDICHLKVDSLSEELSETDNDDDITWVCTTYHSEWQIGKNAGGKFKYSSGSTKFWTNPKFLIELKDVDNDDNEYMATVVVALMQKYTRQLRKKKEYIQINLFKVKDNSNLMFDSNNLQEIGSSQASNSREVVKRFRVKPGSYLIVPCCIDEDREGQFMLRIFTETPIIGSFLDDENYLQDCTQNNQDYTQEASD